LVKIWFIYFAIGLFATVFGAVAGLGGGVIIKPVLDLLGDYDVETIGILSAATVLSMACVSLISSVKSKVQINVKQSFILAIGSILGGIVGKFSFNYIVEWINVSDIVTVIQATMLGILMILIYVLVRHRHSIKTYQLKSPYIIISIGFILGVIAAFLGIGGGPFNVAVLAILFSMNAKESALNSIFIIFFSQISALLLSTFTTGFASFNLTMLPFMIVGGILGGLIGSRIAREISERLVGNIFLVGIVGIIFINIFNIVRFFVV